MHYLWPRLIWLLGYQVIGMEPPAFREQPLSWYFDISPPGFVPTGRCWSVWKLGVELGNDFKPQMFGLDAYVVFTSSPIPKYYSIRNDDLKLQEWNNSASHCWVHSTPLTITLHQGARYMDTSGTVIAIAFCFLLVVFQFIIVDYPDTLSVCCPCSWAAGRTS